MPENVFEELKHYVGFSEDDGAALRALHPLANAHFERIADVFYRRILDHPEARKALEGGESQVGHLKVTLQAWMDTLLQGPWDDAYFERRCRIGRVHVRISLPQHYMFGAMNLLRRELTDVLDESLQGKDGERTRLRRALGKILDLELAIMLHTYREDLLAQNARAERLATFGQLVGSIGHELRNPLGVIETSLFILKGRPAASEDARVAKHLERIGEQVGVANHIVSSLLDMIRDRPLARAPVQLQEVWDSALEAVTRPEGVRVQSEGLAQLPTLQGDAVQLRQVFVNLVENSVQALGESGEVRLTAAQADGEVRLALEDSGPGLDPTIRARVFEPLMTTKARGLGLGLSLVRRILERHGGSIAYVPKAGALGGARFELRLPVSGEVK
ncbi:histidine kinase [Aggregicoccus sp. 17bor-14]|uniref:sensor histidine kinase n=1 Tax=Myxococcaceae TaxID=31 RepID=UPI00129C3483|nr:MULTISPECIES: protoglobin domain-containing protein [Myxococcaceae]MBF5046002.1 histidine kinase [Simulacricoccus sp. 17bor-14]MRI91733.1 histidine kinase [Aggregicoccus sp. 17bor-14]